MKVILKACILFFILIALGCSDEVVILSGRVYDASTGLPIESAIVTDNEYGMKNSALTDENGDYMYETFCEEHTISIEADGYNKLYKTLLTPFFPTYQEIILDIYLDPK